MPQLFFGDIGQSLEADFQICIGRDIIRHFAVIKLFVCHHIEVACAGQTEYNGLFLAGFLAFQCFINCYANGVRALYTGGWDMGMYPPFRYRAEAEILHRREGGWSAGGTG